MKGIRNIVAGVAATALMLGISGNHQLAAQTNKAQKPQSEVPTKVDETKGQLLEIDTLSHETIINMNLDEILKIYGEEKGMEIIREHMLIEVNAVRKKHNAEPLVLDEALNGAAQEQADYMDSTLSLGHTGKNHSDPTSRAKAHNYITQGIVYENVGYLGFSMPCTIENMVELWENSTKGHLETMVGSSHKNLGFGRKSLFYGCSFGK